jgi:hypothetical protein
MRENRLYGSEGGEAKSLPYPYQTKAAPNNYRSDRVSGDPSVIARSPCDEAIQGPQHARRQQPRRSYCGPWIASLRSQ